MNHTTSTLAMPTLCDGTSVGVVAVDNRDRHLLLRRVNFPPGFAPIAGHFDTHGHGNATLAANAQANHGVTLTSLAARIANRPLANACRRVPVAGGPLHTWTVYTAAAEGTVTAISDETATPGWYAPRQLQTLADRTVELAIDAIALTPNALIGLEPVWVLLYAALGTITVSPAGLAAVARLAAQLPPDPGGRNPNRT